MLGLKLRTPSGDFVNAMRAHGLLGVGAGDNVVRLLPPLIIEESHVREAMGMLEAAARDVEATLKTTEAA
jgi:acetylornithine/N-succinyldiaminopimelate aminotransferase